jgi:hypothetical protein
MGCNYRIVRGQSWTADANLARLSHKLQTGAEQGTVNNP